MKKNGQISVVCIDDDRIIHEGIRSLLAPHENIQVVADGYVGAHVLPMVEQYRPDILLLDLSMPQTEDKDNPEQFPAIPTIDMLTDDLPETNIIIFSQHLVPTIIDGAIEKGVRGYILKSDDLSLNIATAVQTVSKQGVYFSESVGRIVFDKDKKRRRAHLSEKQIQALTLVAMHPQASYAQLAPQMNIAESTFKGHLTKSFEALGVKGITGALIRCVQLGIIPLEGVIVFNHTRV